MLCSIRILVFLLSEAFRLKQQGKKLVYHHTQALLINYNSAILFYFFKIIHGYCLVGTHY